MHIQFSIFSHSQLQVLPSLSKEWLVSILHFVRCQLVSIKLIFLSDTELVSDEFQDWRSPLKISKVDTLVRYIDLVAMYSFILHHVDLLPNMLKQCFLIVRYSNTYEQWMKAKEKKSAMISICDSRNNAKYSILSLYRYPR